MLLPLNKRISLGLAVCAAIISAVDFAAPAMAQNPFGNVAADADVAQFGPHRSADIANGPLGRDGAACPLDVSVDHPDGLANNDALSGHHPAHMLVSVGPRLH